MPLDSLFAPAPMSARVSPISAVPTAPSPVSPPALAGTKPAESVWPRALAEAFSQQNGAPTPRVPPPSSPPAPRPTVTAAEIHKLRAEISHLELLIKKLQTELQIERQYNQALELQVRALTQVD
jgi:hypothetical protein